MSECKKTTITNTKNDETIKKINKTDIITIKTLRKNIETILKFCAEGFAEIAGLRINSTIEFVGDMLLTLKKKFDIESSSTFNSTMSALVRKKIQINSSLAFNAVMDTKKIESTEANSTVEFNIGQLSSLGDLDNFTLSEMDIFTLGELGFSEGVNFILRKNLKIDSDIEFNTTIDLLLYSYSRLSTLDPQTLGTLDTETLEQLDRVIVV